MTAIATGWAVQHEDGSITVDLDPGATEASVWYEALGHNPERLMANAKSRGARAFRCEVREIGEET